MDKPTPERAEELAKMLEYEHAYYDARGNRYFDLPGNFVYSLAPILRDYADLRRKWDAVVNAEPVAFLVSGGRLYRDMAHTTMSGAEASVKSREDGSNIAELIRKPE